MRRVVAYASKKLSSAERTKTAYEEEMLSVLHALKSWRHHLMGPRHFRLVSDNHAVTCLKNQPQLSPQHARRQEKLSDFHFDEKHVPGKGNVVADAINRRPDHTVPSSLLSAQMPPPWGSTALPLPIPTTWLLS